VLVFYLFGIWMDAKSHLVFPDVVSCLLDAVSTHAA